MYIYSLYALYYICCMCMCEFAGERARDAGLSMYTCMYAIYTCVSMCREVCPNREVIYNYILYSMICICNY